MSESVSRLSWSQLLWGLFFSPRHTAWEFSQEKNIEKRATFLIGLTALASATFGIIEVIFISENYSALDPDSENNSIFSVLIGVVFILIAFPIYKWVIRIFMKIQKNHEAEKLTAFAASALGVNIHLSMLFLLYVVIVATQLIADKTDTLTYESFTDFGLGIYLVLSIFFNGFYISGIFGREIVRSLVISVSSFFMSFFIIFLVYGIAGSLILTVLHGGLGWLDN